MQTDLSRHFHVQRSNERAFFDHGWLKTYHSFSFADYFDPGNVHWGALRVFNDDRLEPGKGFGKHPHRDMEIVTYVLDGELEHEDSIGNRGVVGPGGAQYMSAGTGITHSEFNHSRVDGLHFIQMWVLPAKVGIRPTYGQHDFARDQRINRCSPSRPGSRKWRPRFVSRETQRSWSRDWKTTPCATFSSPAGSASCS